VYKDLAAPYSALMLECLFGIVEGGERTSSCENDTSDQVAQ
jgi:hypothetical protein